jgi:hypothetical protein
MNQQADVLDPAAGATRTPIAKIDASSRPSFIRRNVRRNRRAD